MTTRKLQLLTQLGYDQPYLLQKLLEEDAISLFCRTALGENNFDSHPTLKAHGEAIAKKCDGLPLALIALGRLLRTKANEEEWANLLHSEIWELPKPNGIIPALRLSYHDLPLHLQQLFAYCSLFPKDYVFDKDELVLLWMAEGFLLRPSTTSISHQRSIESFGHEYFEELLSKSFFQQLSKEKPLYVMHDLINDLATFVAGDFFLRLNDKMDADVTNEALEKYRHMSFNRPKYGVYRNFMVFQKAKSLRTLLAVSTGVKKSWGSFYLSDKILIDLLPKLPMLRVLNLSYCRISRLPESVGSLKHLRYLNLSHTRITHLPKQIGDLYNLQTILMCGCYCLIKLPNSFKNLKNLRHVEISDTLFLKKIPSGIGELKRLQTMSKVIIERANGFAISELKNLNDLHGRLSIERMDKVKNAMDAKEANLFKKELNELEMKWSGVFDGARNETLEGEVLNMLKPRHDKLRKLGIESYGGIKFPSWVGDPSFHRLEHVTIRGCRKCTSLPPLGQLSKLKELFVEGMDGVKDVGSELFGVGNNCGGVAFPSLEILSFGYMHGWEVWSINSGAFPRIRELYIFDCHNLVEASLEALPSLRVLKISDCSDGLLRCIVRAASSVTKLRMKRISGFTQLHGGVMECLRAIENLEIEKCNELRYMWDSEVEASKILVNLRTMRVEKCEKLEHFNCPDSLEKLFVYKCSNLVSLGEKKDVNCRTNLTCLREMEISDCQKLERLNCPNSIEKLKVIFCLNLVSLGEKEDVNCESTLASLRDVEIAFCQRLERLNCPNSVEELRMTYCDSITSIFLPTGGQKLKKLCINRCDKLSEVPLNSSLSLLESLDIHGWPNLKSFPELSCFFHLTSLVIFDCDNLESFPDVSCFIHLSSLHIMYCGNLKSFPDDQLPTLTSLTEVKIYDCPSIEESFPRGLWPPNLSYLSIGGLKKPISMWDPQNFPTSLVYLQLVRRLGEDVVTSSQFSHVLPSSLVTLSILEIKKLESLSIGLQHLTSLEHLKIEDCPTIRSLPKTLLPQLLSLEIIKCPKLNERCGRRGSYWPHISHIPCVELYG